MKKPIFYLTTSLLLIQLIFVVSCQSEFEKLNVSPNDISTVSTNIELKAAMVGVIKVHEGGSNRLAGLWSGSFTGDDRQYVTLFNYSVTNSDFNDDWDDIYAGVARPLLSIEKTSIDKEDFKTAAVAKILRAYTFGVAADLYEDMPYSEAGGDFPTPKFDDQASIYASLQTLLDEAIADVGRDTVGDPLGSADFFYGGDMDKWKKLAYSIKARIYLQSKDYDNAFANASLGIDSADGSFLAPHGQSNSQDANLFYQFIKIQRDGYLGSNNLVFKKLSRDSAFYMGDAKSPDSLRLKYYFDTATTFNIKNGFFSQSYSFPLFSYEENQLILAEAAMRKPSVDKATALTALNNARDAVGTKISSDLGLTGSAAANYVAYVDADFATDADLLTRIMNEKFVTSTGTFAQFSDMRRWQFNIEGMKPNKGTRYPQRFLYPLGEVNSNPNTPTQSNDDLFTPTKANQ